MKKFNGQKLVESFLALDWEVFFKMNDTQEMWKIYIENLLLLLDDMCPFKNFVIDKPREEWVDAPLLEQIAEKDRLLARSYRTKNAEDKQIAKDARIQISIDVHTTREKFVNQITEECKNDPTRFWREIAKLLPSKKSMIS